MASSEFFCLHRGSGNDQSMYICTVYSLGGQGLSWGPDSRFAGDTVDAPALCWYKNSLVVAYRDANNGNLVCCIAQGGTSSNIVIVGSAAGSPALGVDPSSGKLVCAWQNAHTNLLYFATSNSFDSNGLPVWSTPAPFGNDNQMIAGASLVAFNNYLYCFHRGRTGDHQIYDCYFVGNGFSEDIPLKTVWRMESDDTPATAVLGDELFVVARGQTNDMSLGTVRLVSYDSSPGLAIGGDLNYTNNYSAYGPSLIVCGGFLYCVHPNVPSNPQIQYCFWRPGYNTWTADSTVNAGTNAGVALALTQL